MSEMTKEDRFFGVTTPLMAPEKEQTENGNDPKLELEIVDDPPKQPSKQDDDEELSSYGEKVRKRINKLRYEQHEAERQRDAAERMREEAISYAKQLVVKNQQYESLIHRGEGALVSQIKEKATIALEQARSLYKEAYEQGDPEKIISAQEKLLSAQSELREAEKHEQVIQSRPRQQAPVRQAEVPQQFQAPRPSEKALAWTKKNPWFGPSGNRVMTALAYGVHEELIRGEGVSPDSDEYYETIDTVMRQRFPDYFEEEAEDEKLPLLRPTQRTPATVVAPSNRSNGARPRKIQLSASQVSLAKRLGLSPEQYAKQLIKESLNG